ncbi:hypothetical protein LTR53_002745 [Teratosphaeriaceae sp. CCFEE 6253]|nr:hypothetical protein LTR53_002745 [Teratosphaeriaceae sp. CCFEE 6253]
MQQQPAKILKQTVKAAPSSAQPEPGCAGASASKASDSNQSPPPAKRQRKKLDRNAAGQLAIAGSLPSETKESLCVTPIQIEQAPHLKNWKRWAAVKDNLRLAKLVRGEIPSLLVRRLDTLLSSEVVDGRQWQYVSSTFMPNAIFRAQCTTMWNNVSRVNSDYWTVILKNGAVTTQAQSEAQRSVCVPVEHIPAGNTQLVQQFAGELCYLLDHLPMAKVTLKQAEPMTQFLTLAALKRAQHDAEDLGSLVYRDMISQSSPFGFTITWAVEKNKPVFKAYLGMFDGEGRPHNGTSSFVRVRHNEVGDARPIPAIPDALAAMLPAMTYPSTANFDALSDEEKARYNKAVQLCRYIQYTMYGACGEKEALSRQANAILGLFKASVVGKKHWTTKDISDVYDGSRIFRWEKMHNRISIFAAKAVKLSTQGGEPPKIEVTGHSKGGMSSVYEEVHQAYLAGSNILDAWQAGVLKADKVNCMPGWKSFALTCNHSGDERKSAVHICQNCNDVTFCEDMRYAIKDDLQICIQCETKARTADISDYKAGKPQSKPGRNVRHRLINQLQTEYPGPAKKSKAVRQKIADEFIEKWFNMDSGRWADAYADGERRDDVVKTKDTRASPFTGSPDAANPFHVENGKASYHHAANVVPTASYVNFGLNTWLKGNFQVVKDAQALRDSSDYHAYLGVNRRFDHQWAIRRQYPHRRRARQAIEMSEAQFDRSRREWRDGVYADSEDTTYYGVNLATLAKCTWTERDQERFNDLIRQMLERKAGPIALPRGADGAPFPWRAEHMPRAWSWTMLEAHMAWHFELMDYWCDRYFTTEESPETIFLEVVWQWFDNGGRDPFLRLPMTVFVQHATAWALGHVHHGQPMRTGWPLNVRITDIVQRDAARCNVVVEPRISNYMKMDFSETEYPAILEDILSCKDECDWFVRPEGFLPALKLEMSNMLSVKRSMQFVPTAAQTSEGEADELGEEVDAEDIIDDFEDEDDQDPNDEVQQPAYAGKGKGRISDLGNEAEHQDL